MLSIQDDFTYQNLLAKGPQCIELRQYDPGKASQGIEFVQKFEIVVLFFFNNHWWNVLFDRCINVLTKGLEFLVFVYVSGELASSVDCEDEHGSKTCSICER